MKKVIPIIIMVLSLAGSIFCYFSYTSNPDTPPPYYDPSAMHHANATPKSEYYPNGTHRIYVFEGMHPTGSTLMDSNDRMLEENFYKLSDKDGEEAVLVIAETKYYTFWGQYHQIVALILLIVALAALFFAVLPFGKNRRVAASK